MHSTEGHHPYTTIGAEGGMLHLRGIHGLPLFPHPAAERCPDRPELDGQDYIVLNSTSDLSKAIRPLGGYESIHCFLDNDKAGIEAVQELQKEYGLRIRDASHIYEGYNDLNDFLRDKRSGQAQRQQEKSEAEKRQRQTEQPKKKGKGIRM